AARRRSRRCGRVARRAARGHGGRVRVDVRRRRRRLLPRGHDRGQKRRVRNHHVRIALHRARDRSRHGFPTLIAAAVHKRPITVAIIGYLFIAVGSIGLIYHTVEERHPFDGELIWIVLLRLLAIVGGAFLLRGRNWARWLLIAWMGYHVALSVFHSP